MRTMIIMMILFTCSLSAAEASNVFSDPASGVDEGFDNSGVRLEIASPSVIACAGPFSMSVGQDPKEKNQGGLSGLYRSPAKEAGLSFLLPGLGQHRMGNDLRAKVYFGLEGVGWVAAGAFFYQSLVRRDEYEEYADVYAGLNGSGYGESYYETISNYISNDGPGGYNEYVLREARNLYYPDKAAMDDYYEENVITGDMSWRWETDKAYYNYRELFAGSDTSRRRAVYALFFIVGLRVVSMVDALKLARDSNERMDREPGISIHVEPERGGFRMSLCRSF
ncbi:MAG: hypothetical protein KOO63_06860 [Bacteroidales bacterium]|nr:hypothetical protein [Candidatus Latescibacterota bacterium]